MLPFAWCPEWDCNRLKKIGNYYSCLALGWFYFSRPMIKGIPAETTPSFPMNRKLKIVLCNVLFFFWGWVGCCSCRLINHVDVSSFTSSDQLHAGTEPRKEPLHKLINLFMSTSHAISLTFGLDSTVVYLS